METWKTGIGPKARRAKGKLEPESRALAGIIRRRREGLGWTLVGLEEKSGVCRQMLGYLEDDKRVGTSNTLACIARAFGITNGRLNTEADEWLARQPACCRKCHYSCIARGELKWLSRDRKCMDPAKYPPAPATIPPDLQL